MFGADSLNSVTTSPARPLGWTERLWSIWHRFRRVRLHHKQHRVLFDLDDHLLSDIGASRDQARQGSQEDALDADDVWALLTTEDKERSHRDVSTSEANLSLKSIPPMACRDSWNALSSSHGEMQTPRNTAPRPSSAQHSNFEEIAHGRKSSPRFFQ